ncbi:hypothetical protein MD484_g8310, partial [Candolleomyces efflorescens]
MKAPRITHFPAREWNVRAQLRSETSTSIRLPIVSSTDRGRFHPYLPVQSGLPATAPSSAPPTQDVDVGATSHTLDAAPLSEELGGADSQSLAQSADLESETDRREQRPVQVKIDDNLQFGGQPTAEVAVETGDAPVLPDNSNQTEPATHVGAPGGSSRKDHGARIGTREARRYNPSIKDLSLTGLFLRFRIPSIILSLRSLEVPALATHTSGTHRKANTI